MPKQNKTGRSTGIPGGYIRVDGYLMDCEAWKALTPCATRIYLALKRRYRANGNGKQQKSNNGRIPMSRREMMDETGFREGAVSRGAMDLIAKGFIKITRDSAFNIKETRAREFALTEFPVGDKLATKDFLKWTPDEKQNTGAESAPDGCGKRTRKANSTTSNVHLLRPTGAKSALVNGADGCGKRTTSTYHRVRAKPGSKDRDWLEIGAT